LQGLQCCRESIAAGLQDYRRAAARPQDCRAVVLQRAICRVAGFQGCRAAGITAPIADQGFRRDF
jgi:hypothetical protein